MSVRNVRLGYEMGEGNMTENANNSATRRSVGGSPRPAADIGRLIDSARGHAMLAPEEEHALLVRFRADGDPAAAERLVGSHLRLVISIAREYRGYGQPFADLVAEGYLGLMLALDRFDPERGVRLATYATWWIRAQVRDFVLRSQSLVKMGTTAHQKKLFYNLRRMKAQLGELGEGDLPSDAVAEIARTLEVPAADVVDMNRRLQAADASLNSPVGAEGDTDWQDLLVDGEQDPETFAAERDELDKRRALLAGGLDSLSERERDIVRERCLRDEPLTLEVLSQRYRISRERVRQIEAKALGKLRTAMGVPPADARHADVSMAA
jgi:RNA polymerase sigma-32 factor